MGEIIKECCGKPESQCRCDDNKGNIVIICSGGCGKTTEQVSPREFWAGKVEQSSDPEELVPVWTCKECVSKMSKADVPDEKLREEIAKELCLYCQKQDELGDCHTKKPCRASLNTSDQILSLVASHYEAKLKAEKERIKTLEQAIEDDATDLWNVTNAIKKEIKAREWIMEGRGCYAWDDERYKDETRLAFEAVMKLIAEVQHPAQLRFQSVIGNPSGRKS